MRDSNKTSKTLVITLVIATVVTLGGVATWLNVLKGESDSKDIKTTEQVKAPGDLDKIAFIAEANKSVLEQLQAQNRTVETKDSQYGKYVDSINGKKGGTDNKYWTFYVDGKMADKGAADYVTNGGEKIEWKFE